MLHAIHAAIDTTEPGIAFQPLLQAGSDLPFAWAAEARGGDGDPGNRAALAVRRAVAAGIVESEALLFVAVDAACAVPDRVLARLLDAAHAHCLPTDRILVEVSGDERGSLEAAERLAEACALEGLAVALGAYSGGHVGLNLLARFKPRFVRLDRSLVRNIDCSDSRRLIVEGTLRLARGFGSTLIAPAAETQGEFDALRRIGIRHMQRSSVLRALPSAVAPRREPRSIPLGTQRDTSTHRRPFAAEPAAARYA